MLGLRRPHSMSPRLVRRYMRVRLIMWLLVLLSSGSVLGFFAFRRWEGLTEEAEPRLEGAGVTVWANPTDKAIYRLRARLEGLDAVQKRGILKAALEDVKPDSAVGHHIRGWLFELEEPSNLDDATNSYRNASVADPQAMFPHYCLGLLYYNQTYIEMAVAEFETAVSLNSQYAEAQFALGSCLHKQGDLDFAMSQYRLASRIDPVNPKYLYMLGLALEQQGRLMDAIATYTKCIQLDQNYALAYHNLGRIQEMQGRFEEALTMYNIYLQREPDAKEREKVERKIQQLAGGASPSP